MYEPPPCGYARIVWRYETPTASIRKTIASATGTEYRSPGAPASTSTASIASGPYATDDSASADSTGSATSLRIRSRATAELRSGAPSTARRIRARVLPVSPAPSQPTSTSRAPEPAGRPTRGATGTKRPKRAGTICAGSGKLPTSGSTGRAWRQAAGSADTRPHSCPTSRSRVDCSSLSSGTDTSELDGLSCSRRSGRGPRRRAPLTVARPHRPPGRNASAQPGPCRTRRCARGRRTRAARGSGPAAGLRRRGPRAVRRW